MSAIPVIPGWIVIIGILAAVAAILIIAIGALLAIRYLKRKKV